MAQEPRMHWLKLWTRGWLEERGERFPSAHILRKIAKPLGFDEAELLTHAGFLSPRASTTENEIGTGKLLSQEPIEIQCTLIGLLSILKTIQGERELERKVVTGKVFDLGLKGLDDAIREGERDGQTMELEVADRVFQVGVLRQDRALCLHWTGMTNLQNVIWMRFVALGTF